MEVRDRPCVGPGVPHALASDMKVLRITVALVTLGPLSLSSVYANESGPPGTDAFSRLVNNARQRHDGAAPLVRTPATAVAHAVAPVAAAPAAPAKPAPGSSLMHLLSSHWHLVPVTHADTYIETPPKMAAMVTATATPSPAAKVEEASTPADVTKAVAQAYGGKLPK